MSEPTTTASTNPLSLVADDMRQVDAVIARRLDLVLGCTHYIFAADTLRSLVGPNTTLIDTGAPVARRTYSLLHATGMLRKPAQAMALAEQCTLFTTGELSALQHAAEQWLQMDAAACSNAMIS